MSEKSIANQVESYCVESYCGLSCKECALREANGCQGCAASKGKPYYGECKLAQCAISKNRRFCGECGEFPCELLKSYSYDAKNGDNGNRIENCKRIKSALVKEARKNLDPIGVCGHHCDNCFMGQWCGGCRSDYNCCSFATLFEDGICPNVRCAGEKGLDGCYQCVDLEKCSVGFFGNENQYAAKATSMFIKKHGKTVYTLSLNNAINSGLKYTEDLDNSGGVTKALELLEKHLT
ncbi:MAG: DUF3795 domain-containing protein [Ruminococcus sp.]